MNIRVHITADNRTIYQSEFDTAAFADAEALERASESFEVEIGEAINAAIRDDVVIRLKRENKELRDELTALKSRKCVYLDGDEP